MTTTVSYATVDHTWESEFRDIDFNYDTKEQDFMMFVTSALLRLYDTQLLLIDDEDTVELVRELHGKGMHQW